MEAILRARKDRLKGHRTEQIDFAISCVNGYNPALDPMAVVIAELALEANEAELSPEVRHQANIHLEFLRSLDRQQPRYGIILLS